MNNNIDAHYKELRKKNELERNGRRTRIYREIPELQRIDSEIKSISTNLALSAFDEKVDPEILVEISKKKIYDLRIQKAILLTDNNYPSTYLDPIYTCNKCFDRGFINGIPCECYNAIKIEVGAKKSNLYNLMKTQNFDTFDFSLYSNEEFDEDFFLKGPNSMSIRQYMKTIVDNLKYFIEEDEQFGAYIYGDTGVGKTFLCSSLCRYAIELGKSAEYYSMNAFREIISNYIFKNKYNWNEDFENYKQSYEALYKCDVLILDDLGTELSNSAIISEIFSIVNERLAARKKTIISSNINIENIANFYEERTASRILGEYLPIMIIGNDLRNK